MKLIDGQIIADELLGEIFERGQASRLWEQQLEIGALTYKDIEFANGYDLALDNLYRQIRDAEEIKAIPIEFIRAYLNELNKEAEKEWEYVINEIGGSEPCYCEMYARGIKHLIESWEKENDLL